MKSSKIKKEEKYSHSKFVKRESQISKNFQGGGETSIRDLRVDVS